ncbi:helicase associated domain-containing protein [Streptomyces sp. NPDC059544]|uniref:helicase associated domain-containing protein n=1 Tax=Streptomyces sp. NPDC059544 TaxID=3346861 RepID=UPI00369CD85A
MGRALRMQPGEGKTASLVVPVFLGAGEGPDEMLVSKAYTDLAKVLTALRAHDTEAVEQLAVPQAAGRLAGGISQVPEEGGISGPARGLLSFSTPRDPAALAAFITARVLKPEGEYLRRGLHAALAYCGDHGHLNVPIGHTAPDGFPLGGWIARQRHAHRHGDLSEERVSQLDELSMIWSHYAVAFDEGLAAARGWAAEHGHLLAPTEATWQGFPVGTWLKNQRAAARRAAGGKAGEQPAAGGLSAERRQELEDIDPAWCPAWPIAWQRCFHLARVYQVSGGTIPDESGLLIMQGEDIGHWAVAQRAEWYALAPAQQWLLSEVLGLAPADEPAAAEKVAAPRRSRAEMWAANLRAARQYAHREGHLNVPRTHSETVDADTFALGCSSPTPEHARTGSRPRGSPSSPRSA